MKAQHRKERDGQDFGQQERETRSQERQGPARETARQTRYLYFEARMQRNNIWQRERQVNEKTTKLTINKYMRERRKQQVQ
eukprot:scaffold172079_cov32-Attheya_sp.AAC.1